MDFDTKELKELDDLLNFDYGNRESASNEAELYAALRRQSNIQHNAAEAERRARAAAEERARSEARAQAEARARAAAEARALHEARARAVAEEKARSEARAQAEARLLEARRAAEQERLRMTALEEEAARRKAQEEAYARYRANSANNAGVTSSTRANRKADKKAAKRAAAGAVSKKAARGVKGAKFGKALSSIYLIALAAFTAIMTVMNVLPFHYLIATYVLLGILSLIIVTQLCRVRIKKWARVLATFMAIILISVYGIGSAYALGTLDFLSGSSVKNDNRVDRISEESFNVIMTGMDVNGTIDEQGRSDVNMVVTINPKTATILMTSIPRDYEIRMPQVGYATDKLTHTGFYGVDYTISSIEDLLSINANYYVKVNFTTVKKFVNAIGGIDVYSEYEFEPEKCKGWTVKEGWNHMNGKQALAFARERHSFRDGDNQRVKNQQAVFEALINKATSSSTILLSYSKILNNLRNYFEMSFSSREIRSLMKLQLAKNPKWKIYKNTLYGQGASKTTYTGGSQPLYVTEQNATSIAYSSGLINAVLDGKTLKENEDKTISIVEEGDNQ